MKFSALLQIVLLLITSLIPEGRLALTQSSDCRGTCACSAQARHNGACCCTHRKTSRSDTGRQPRRCCEHRSSGRTSGSGTEARSCCSGKSGAHKIRSDTHRNPAAPAPPARERAGLPQGMIVSCPCGGDASATLVLHAPRTAVSRAQLTCLPDFFVAYVPVSEGCAPAGDPPDRRPPKSHSC